VAQCRIWRFSSAEAERRLVHRPIVYVDHLCEATRRVVWEGSLDIVGRHRDRPGDVVRASNATRREAIHGYLFLAPWLLGFFVLTLGPSLASLFLSFTNYNVIRPPMFVGSQNYLRAFTRDNLFYSSFARTFYYSMLFVPASILSSLVLALLLNFNIKGRTIFRAMFFLPSLVPMVAAVVLWLSLLQPNWGIVNSTLRSIGLLAPNWFGDPRWAVPSLILISLWTTVGGTRMVIILAGLQGVPEELYDAAAIDGAGAWRCLLHVTLPLITPTIFFNLVLGIISSLQVFTSAFVATGGGPAYATWFFGLHIYKQAFSYFNMGYACALAWFFALVIMLLTAIQQRTSRSWVFYYGN